MTSPNGSTIPDKNIRFCAATHDYEIRIDGQIIGYAATHLRAYAIANEFVYLQLSTSQGNPAECSPEEAAALLAVQIMDVPVMLELAAQDELERMAAEAGVPEARPLPPMHPVVRLVDEAALWTRQVLRAA